MLPQKKILIIFLFAVAFLLRLLLVPNPGFEADVSFWKSWGLATADFGIVEGIKQTNNNYPTPFAYTLGLMVKVYSVFKDPHSFNEFWQNTNLPFLAVSKLFPILADLGIAVLILWIGKNARSLGFPDSPARSQGPPGRWRVSLYELFAVFYLFNPVSLIDGALWGQVDSVGVFTFLLALLALLKRKPFLAGFVFMFAMMTKLQNMIYGPLFFLFVWQTTRLPAPDRRDGGQVGFNGLLKAITGATVGFFGLNIEFFLSKNMDRVLASLTSNYDYFPWMSLNAFNLWWIVSGAHGMQVSDKLAVLGITNAKTLGLLLFSSFYLFAILRQVFTNGAARHPFFRTATPTHYGAKDTFGERLGRSAKKVMPSEATLRIFLESLIIANAAFFLFQTQSHDRYAFPLSVFLLLWAPFFLTTKHYALCTKHFNLFSLFYVLFTLFYFYNLHTALIFNYPNNGLPILSKLISPALTISASVFQIGLFVALILFLIRSSRSTFYSLLFTLFIFTFAIFMANKPLWTTQPVALTKITPFISSQDFGSRQTNRSVNSSFGINSWNRLSVQYVFYRQGIGTHANSRHVFDINRKFSRFTTDYGMDTESGPQASAVFEIYGDDKLLYRSETMRKFDLPKYTEIDIRGVKYLSLVTTDAGDGNIDDHTDWLNPKLWP